MSERFLRLWLRVTYLFFLLQGLYWVVTGSFDPFGLWDHLAGQALYGGELPPDAVRFKRLSISLLGATNAAFWLLCLILLEIPLAKNERWAIKALWAGLLLWFAIDSTSSLVQGATFNFLLVNLPCLVLAGVPLLLLGRQIERNLPSADSASSR